MIGPNRATGRQTRSPSEICESGCTGRPSWLHSTPVWGRNRPLSRLHVHSSGVAEGRELTAGKDNSAAETCHPRSLRRVALKIYSTRSCKKLLRRLIHSPSMKREGKDTLPLKPATAKPLSCNLEDIFDSALQEANPRVGYSSSVK